MSLRPGSSPGGKVVARDVDWPQPLKYLSFDDRGLTVTPSADGKFISVKTQKPVKGLVFEEREGVLLTDSAIDAVPGDEQIVGINGLKVGDAALRWTFLGRDELA